MPTHRHGPIEIRTLDDGSVDEVLLYDEQGRCPFADFVRVMVPVDQLPDAERVRVERWAAKTGGVRPTTSAVFQVHPRLLAAQAAPSLFPTDR